MNDPTRREIAFAAHASLQLFECLIVAGAPATGLLHDVVFKDEGAVQMTLRLLRDMWQRADTLYVPQADLQSLHRMECDSTLCHETPVPDRIATDARKLARYYVYLLFRYCMSSAGHAAYNREGFAANLCMSQRKPKIRVAPLSDIPGGWLETKACSSQPSAPPIQDDVIGFTRYPLSSAPQQQQQQQQPLEHHQWYPMQQQWPHQPVPDYPQLNRMQQQEQQQERQQQQQQQKGLPVQHSRPLYPDVTEYQSSIQPRTMMGLDSRPRVKKTNTKPSLSKRFDTESEEEY